MIINLLETDFFYVTASDVIFCNSGALIYYF